MDLGMAKIEVMDSLHSFRMNIFVLSKNPKRAAKYHLDKHVIKMLLEACQLLYTAHWAFAFPELLKEKSAIALSKAQKALPVPSCLSTAPHSKTRKEEPGFRPVHIHHPCARWVRESTGNYLWTATLACALADEYEFRWPGRGSHQCAAHAQWLLEHLPPALPEKPLEDFVQAMEDRFKDPNAIVAYRTYYKISKGEERGMLKYTKRDPPKFLSEE